MRCYRKRHVTLLELLISMALTMVLLTILSDSFYEVKKSDRLMDEAQNESFQMRYVENRLSNVIPKAISPKDNSGDFHFFSDRQNDALFMQNSSSLVFTFDNCVKLNRNFTYHVIGRFYLDPEGNFTLALWPSKRRWKENEPPPMYREILLSNVEALDFSFFVAPEKGKTNEEKPATPDPDQPLGLEGGWVQEWKGEFRQLPAIMKIILKLKGGETLIYAFPFPNAKQSITYDE